MEGGGGSVAAACVSPVDSTSKLGLKARESDGNTSESARAMFSALGVVLELVETGKGETVGTLPSSAKPSTLGARRTSSRARSCAGPSDCE